MLYEQQAQPNAVTGRNEPYLVHLGPSQFTAREVLDESKTDDRGSRDAGKSAQAAYWITETLTASGPMLTEEFMTKAQADGVFGSRNTFDRARKLAQVLTGKVGKQWWVWLDGQAPPDANSPSSAGDDPGGDDPDETNTNTSSPPAPASAEPGGDEATLERVAQVLVRRARKLAAADRRCTMPPRWT